jgi:hypothetical protein
MPKKVNNGVKIGHSVAQDIAAKKMAPDSGAIFQ